MSQDDFAVGFGFFFLALFIWIVVYPMILCYFRDRKLGGIPYNLVGRNYYPEILKCVEAKKIGEKVSSAEIRALVSVYHSTAYLHQAKEPLVFPLLKYHFMSYGADAFFGLLRKYPQVDYAVLIFGRMLDSQEMWWISFLLKAEEWPDFWGQWDFIQEINPRAPEALKTMQEILARKFSESTENLCMEGVQNTAYVLEHRHIAALANASRAYEVVDKVSDKELKDTLIFFFNLDPNYAYHAAEVLNWFHAINPHATKEVWTAYITQKSAEEIVELYNQLCFDDDAVLLNGELDEVTLQLVKSKILASNWRGVYSLNNKLKDIMCMAGWSFPPEDSLVALTWNHCNKQAHMVIDRLIDNIPFGHLRGMFHLTYSMYYSPDGLDPHELIAELHDRGILV